MLRKTMGKKEYFRWEICRFIVKVDSIILFEQTMVIKYQTPCKNPNLAHFICRHQTNNFIYSKCMHTLFAMLRSNNSDISLYFFTEKVFCALLKPQFDILFELYIADRPCSWTPTYIIYYKKYGKFTKICIYRRLNKVEKEFRPSYSFFCFRTMTENLFKMFLVYLLIWNGG